MARGSKVVINRKVFSEVVIAVADGVFEVGKAIVELAAQRAPDSPYDPFPLGEGLPKQGGVLAYANGKKVGGFGLDGRQPRAPRAARVTKGEGIQVIAGWGFPARFNEFGTVRMSAQPFFTPSAEAVLPQATRIMAPVVKGKLPRRG